MGGGSAVAFAGDIRVFGPSPLAAVFARRGVFCGHPREFALEKRLRGWAEDRQRAGCDQTHLAAPILSPFHDTPLRSPRAQRLLYFGSGLVSEQMLA
jgi:hypothetical protein